MRYSTMIKIVKVAGMALGIAGTIATGWADTKQSKLDMSKMVRDQLKHVKKH